MGKKGLYSVVIIVLIAASISFAQRLLTAGYPTHSDVFFLGVECGVLLSSLIGCLVLICWFLYHLFYRKRAREIIEPLKKKGWKHKGEEG